MLSLFKNRKAQNTAEYAIMIVVVIGVFTAMQLYIRRGLQMRIKLGADKIPGYIVAQTNGAMAGEFFGNVQQTQYDPYYLRHGSSDTTLTSAEGTEVGTAAELGGVRTLTNATTQRRGSQTITSTDRAD